MVYGELKTGKHFKRQSFTKSLRVTVVLTRIGSLRENLISVLQEIFGIINKILILTGTLGAWLSFSEV